MKTFPIKYFRIALGSLLVVLVAGGLVSIFTSRQNAVVFMCTAYLAGMADFSIMYHSMLKAMRVVPERALNSMRKGMMLRFLVALLLTVTMLKVGVSPAGILIGLLITHVVVLIDGVLLSMKDNR